MNFTSIANRQGLRRKFRKLYLGLSGGGGSGCSSGPAPRPLELTRTKNKDENGCVEAVSPGSDRWHPPPHFESTT